MSIRQPAPPDVPGKGGALDLLGQASDARELSQCMDRLSPPQRQSVALAFFDGLSHAVCPRNCTSRWAR